MLVVGFISAVALFVVWTAPSFLAVLNSRLTNVRIIQLVPPELEAEVEFSLESFALVDLQANGVMTLVFMMESGRTFEKSIFFESVTVPPGGIRSARGFMTLTLGDLSPQDRITSVKGTLTLNISGPLSLKTVTYELPL